MKTWRLLCLTVLLALHASRALAQVIVAPVVLLTSERNRFASYVVMNRTGTEQEVTVDFRFGYPVADSAGSGLRMVYDSTTSATHFSLQTWARAFPRRFLLNPGEQQTVRIMLTPPAGLADGVYWTRIVTASNPVSPPVDTTGGRLQALITIRLEQSTTLLHRRGSVRGGVAIGDVRTRVDSAGVHVAAPLTRTGNAPFYGTVTATVFDAGGKRLAEGRQPISVFFDAIAEIEVALPSLPPGTYRVEVNARPGRDDIPPEDTLPADGAARTVPLVRG